MAMKNTTKNNNNLINDTIIINSVKSALYHISNNLYFVINQYLDSLVKLLDNTVSSTSSNNVENSSSSKDIIQIKEDDIHNPKTNTSSTQATQISKSKKINVRKIIESRKSNIANSHSNSENMQTVDLKSIIEEYSQVSQYFPKYNFLIFYLDSIKISKTIQNIDSNDVIQSFFTFLSKNKQYNQNYNNNIIYIKNNTFLLEKYIINKINTLITQNNKQNEYKKFNFDTSKNNTFNSFINPDSYILNVSFNLTKNNLKQLTSIITTKIGKQKVSSLISQNIMKLKDYHELFDTCFIYFTKFLIQDDIQILKKNCNKKSDFYKALEKKGSIFKEIKTNNISDDTDQQSVVRL
ncbi:hypothetical protein EDEG_02536 [Edhazardia aedis USNM 41457]|uniref:Uncharacterized protein n=1 Tax=Edhazardia aedis (strain USNM 41457) TaxID=1003232 RepID=J9D6F0_EDHAE|nr:hypothetical protein EDEG_02536 [Edhazardia aedis USNM 41457]|eukprot:EJW03084.1 hypothetical protein EDEG_02536 [Edhazardia aedis USNM 41457]